MVQSTTRVLWVILITLLACSATSDPIVGRWSRVGQESYSEFFADGKGFIDDDLAAGSVTLTISWQRLDKHRIRVEAMVFGVATGDVLTTLLQNDTLTLTDSKGKVKRYSRTAASAPAPFPVAPSQSSAPSQLSAVAKRDLPGPDDLILGLYEPRAPSPLSMRALDYLVLFRGRDGLKVSIGKRGPIGGSDETLYASDVRLADSALSFSWTASSGQVFSFTGFFTAVGTPNTKPTVLWGTLGLIQTPQPQSTPMEFLFMPGGGPR